MISATGSRTRRSSIRCRGGFTLFEIMVTAVILTVGLVTIYEALLVSVNVYSYYSKALDIQTWMDVKIWEVREGMLAGENPSVGAGTFQSGNKDIHWRSDMRPAAGGAVYQVSLVCSWREGGRDVELTRVVYVSP